MRETTLNNLLLGSAIGLGVFGAGALLAFSVLDMKEANRAVTVRGVAEKEVQADLSTWDLKFLATGDDLAATQGAVETQKQQLFTFLESAGITADEVTLAGLDVTDRDAENYGDARNKKRYTITARVVVRSTNIAAMVDASRKIGDLLKSGVTLADRSYCNSGPSYTFTQLNDVKPAMLADATASARNAAEQFAADSGSKVGKIRKATQGYFSIVERDHVDTGSGGEGGCGLSTPNKKVRVVTTIDYSLE